MQAAIYFPFSTLCSVSQIATDGLLAQENTDTSSSVLISVDSGLCQAPLYTDDVSLLERKYKYQHYIISISKGVFISLPLGDSHTVSMERKCKSNLSNTTVTRFQVEKSTTNRSEQKYRVILNYCWGFRGL
jgi:hypothetical protein